MLSKLISLPFRTARGAVTFTTTALGRAMAIASDLVRDKPPTVDSQPEWAPRGNGSVPDLSTPPVARPRMAPVRAKSDPAPAPAREAAHIETEPELVAERADPGAENGAGAALTVDEPWSGYSDCAAQDIIDRLASADPSELAVTQLYEQTHKRRKTVLAALEQAFKADERKRAS
jgi:hypothetical protein